ncbi:MAG: energy transducer TonB [Candidatus Aminicenantes bacterium]|nr:MAG: energy transducer TonB [Candidatus Aminicenantes bacterium]
MIIEGEPRGVIFTVTCTFKLAERVRAVGDIKPPKLIKKIQPVYPESARKAGIEGAVIVEATTDIYGKVVKTKILRSIPELDQAAMDAVKQWVYEPYIKEGKPVGMIFTVTVVFKLD